MKEDNVVKLVPTVRGQIKAGVFFCDIDTNEVFIMGKCAAVGHVLISLATGNRWVDAMPLEDLRMKLDNYKNMQMLPADTMFNVEVS